MTTRLFLFPNENAPKPTIVLECEKLGKGRATVPAHISLISVKAGMVGRPGEGRQVDRKAPIVVVATVEQKKTGLSTITFAKEELSPPVKPEPEASKA